MSGRGTYHHGDLRQAILEAACQHLRREGADTLSLRALAREIGVSQTAPYRHFDSRNALFAGIATWGFEILDRELSAVVENHNRQEKGDAMALLVEMGLTYLDFSKDHFEKYRLFYDSSLVDFAEYPALQEVGTRAHNLMLEGIRQGQAEGVFIDGPAEQLGAVVWAGLHGLAGLLQIRQPAEDLQDKPAIRAVNYLSQEPRQALSLMLKAIT